MKIKVNGVLFEIVLSFSGSLVPWHAEAHRLFDFDNDNGNYTSIITDVVASGTTPDTALQAIALELSEVY